MGSQTPTSSDPSDATFSYQSDKQELYGPFCSHCMNRWAETLAKNPKLGIYIHYKSMGKFYRLEELLDHNGIETPFTFRKLDEEVRKNQCFYQKCRANLSPRAPSAATLTSPVNGCEMQPTNTETKKLITRLLPKSNPPYVTEKRPVEFPLLHGTCYRLCKPVTLEQWKERSRCSWEVYNHIAPHKQQVKEAFDALNWKTTNCEVCGTIDPEEPYAEHVLSEQHFRNLSAAKRWVTLQHFDIFDGYCRSQEKSIKEGKTSLVQKLALQQQPLLAMWNSPNTRQMPRKEYEEKLDSLSSVLRTVDYRRLNKQNPLGTKSEVCFWCNIWVEDMSGVIEHLLTRQHRDYLFEKSYVSVRDIDGYISMVNQAKEPAPLRTETSNPRASQPSPAPGNKEPSSDSNLLKLPFQTGHDNPSHPMRRSDIVNVSIVVKDLVRDLPRMKHLLNEVLVKKGQCLQSCAPCKKKFPAAISVLEHVITPTHIDTITSQGLCFSRLYDFLPLVVILLDALKISHQGISVDNIEEYFDKIKSPTQKTVGAPEVKFAKVKISKLEQPPTCPFLMPRSNPRQQLTEEECLNLTKSLRGILCENERVRKGISTNATLTSIKCFVCNKVFNSSYQTWEHVIASKHISQVYAQKTSFCYVEDYLEAVRTLYRALDSAVDVTADNAADIVTRMMLKKPKKASVSTRAELRTAASGGPSPSRSSSSTSIASSTTAPVQRVQGCKMTTNGRSLRFMNVDSEEREVLTDDQLFTLCRAVKAQLCDIYRCYFSEYNRLGPVCPTSCLVCEYRALGVCDFVIHLFEELHYNKLIERRVKVSASDVQFWIDQLLALRRGSLKMAPPNEDALSKCWESIGMRSSNVQAPSITSLLPSHFL